MKNFTLSLAFATCLALPISATADETPLEEQMEALGGAYKGFRKETDIKKGADETRKAQTAVAKSLAEAPAMLAKMPAGPEKAKKLSAYRQMMGELYVLLCKAEQAFLNDKAADVPAIVDEMKKLKKAGHTDFMED